MKRALAACVLAGLSACANQFPATGPTTPAMQAGGDVAGVGAIQVIDIDSMVVRRLNSERRFKPFSDTLARRRTPADIGRGDTLEVDIWEAPPATLFGGGTINPAAPSTVHATTLPEQMVDREGFISVPFAGRIQAEGKTPQAVEAAIGQRLKGKANQPEVMVRVVRNTSSTVTVVGEVVNSTRMPLTSGGERLLDALAAAGGVRQPVAKTTVQITRGEQVQSLPLDQIIREPAQNIVLEPGDVVTAMFQPLSFTTLGATTKNEEIAFESQGISLAQALARSGGLIDSRSNPEGVFIFRLERANAIDWPHQPVATTPEGLVPVVYRMNARDPAAFFMMQSFQISDKDVIYVSNAPAAELQKFLNLVFSLVYPLINVYSVTR